MPIAITRPVSPSIGRCELTHLPRQPIDAALAAAQHQAYEAALVALGLVVERLPALPELPDAVFVEDCAVVTDELAVITRPGAATRRQETPSVAATLARHRPVAALQAPATLDGGDVLRLGRRILVGASSRSNPDGVHALAGLLGPLGYRVEALPLRGCLHLKSAVTQVAPDAVLLNPAWVDPGAFAGLRVIAVDPDEPHAANALLAGGRAVFPTTYRRTADRLAAAGVDLVQVDVSELAKAEGAVTCCSLILADLDGTPQ